MELLCNFVALTIKENYQARCTGGGLPKIVSRRARKGFNVKLNVDAKWSCSMYKILDYIQLRNGLDKVVMNRDDAAGFQLDTTFTHKQHPVLQDNSNA